MRRPSPRPAAVVHVTANPTAEWTAQQIVEAFPEDTAPRYLLRDRDCVYGPSFRRRVHGLGISEVLTAARSPWQNPYAERVIGSIRRECLDHVDEGRRVHQGEERDSRRPGVRERKRNFVGQHFWARGYFVSTVGRDAAVTREYIRRQEVEDKRRDQLGLC